MRAWPALPLLAALAACGKSPPATFLAIDPAPGAVAAYAGPPVRVPFVHVPIALDRVEYAAETAGQVKVEDFSRWAAPLPLLARDAFVRDLTARLPAGAVLPADAAPATPELRIEVTVTGFRTDTGAATMEATYRLVRPAPPRGPAPLAVPEPVTLTAPLAPGAAPAAAAQAWGALLGQLADRIAAEIAATPR